MISSSNFYCFCCDHHCHQQQWLRMEQNVGKCRMKLVWRQGQGSAVMWSGNRWFNVTSHTPLILSLGNKGYIASRTESICALVNRISWCFVGPIGQGNVPTSPVFWRLWRNCQRSVWLAVHHTPYTCHVLLSLSFDRNSNKNYMKWLEWVMPVMPFLGQTCRLICIH
jgi:hypothetical protein